MTTIRINAWLARSSSCQFPTHRQACKVSATSKGFGPSAPSKGGTGGKKLTGKTPEDAADKVLRKMPKMRHPSVRGQEEAKGRLDYVQVESWGKNMDNDVDLGNLKVKQYSTSAPEDDKRPFYEQLVLYLQLLETRGSLAVVRPKNAPPLPPFEKWSFARSHYLQYLCDQYTLHQALERACSRVLEAAEAEGRASLAEHALRTVAQLELDRAEVLELDLLALSAAESVDTGVAADAIVEALKPSARAASYSEFLWSIEARCMDTEESEDKRSQATCALLANFFVIHVSHLTTVVRIGAKATESLGLFPLKAVNYYHKYPEGVDDPMKDFVAGMNEAGTALGSTENRDSVKEDLAKAMQKCSQLLNVLAVEAKVA